MRKILFPVLAACLLGQACTEQNPDAYMLRGEIKNFPAGMVYLNYGSPIDGIEHIDSTAVKNGRFVFKGVVDQPYMAVVAAEARPNYTAKTVNFYIEPGNLNLKADWNALEVYELTGSKTSDEARFMEKRMKKFMDESNALRAKIASAVSPEEKKAWGDSLQGFGARVQQAQLDFMDAHPASCISASNLRAMSSRMETEELKRRFSLLDEKVRNGYNGQAIAKEIALRERLQPGRPAPEFAATDINGKAFRLSDLRGKYVILDFWASWCVPCRAANPHLVGLWRKYHHKGLEIVCIADNDRTQDKWRDAIKKDGIGMFHHLLRGMEMDKSNITDTSNDLSALYNVHFLPTKYLIDTDGNIVGKMSTEEITAELAKIFAAKK